MNFDKFLEDLERGHIRPARKVNGQWMVDSEVKAGILRIFRESAVIAMDGNFHDKEPLKPQTFSLAQLVRVVPGGSSVRKGAFVGPNVVIMPPSFINIGAYVDEGTMVDSHVLVGSCAQIGKRVHLSAGVQIGGVLEPVGQRPVIVEDDCFIGAGVILTEGILVEYSAVIAAGVSLSASVPIYDAVHGEIIYGRVPPFAVVVPGSRPATGPWATEQGLNLACAIIVKYRDQKTTAALMLEDALRS